MTEPKMKLHEAIENLAGAIYAAKQLEKMDATFAYEPVKGALAALVADCQAVIDAYEAEDD